MHKMFLTFFMCVMYSLNLHPLCTVCTTIVPRVLHFSAVHLYGCFFPGIALDVGLC